MKWFNKLQYGFASAAVSTWLNVALLFVFALGVAGCGTSLSNLSPIQPAENIAEALMLKSQNPENEVTVPKVPAEELVTPFLAKHGMQTVGFRVGKARNVNMQALTYLLAFEEYAHLEKEWGKFLNEWDETKTQIEMGKGDDDKKMVDVVLVSHFPTLFDVQAKQPIVTKSLDGITVSIVYWRRPDLDRKYNRGNAFSPFYETEALHQGDKTDVFYVKITNNRSENILFDVKNCKIIDQGDNEYYGLDYDDLEERLVLIPRATGLYVKNGLEKARQILIERRMKIVEKQVGARRTGVPPGESVEGFVAFSQTKLNAIEINVVLPIEKAPPPEGAQRYQTVEFEFPFIHDRGIRIAQPSPRRY